MTEEHISISGRCRAVHMMDICVRRAIGIPEQPPRALGERWGMNSLDPSDLVVWEWDEPIPNLLESEILVVRSCVQIPKFPKTSIQTRRRLVTFNWSAHGEFLFPDSQ